MVDQVLVPPVLYFPFSCLGRRVKGEEPAVVGNLRCFASKLELACKFTWSTRELENLGDDSVCAVTLVEGTEGLKYTPPCPLCVDLRRDLMPALLT